MKIRLKRGPRVVGRDSIEVDFRRVMASVTEQACAAGTEVDVMEILFPLFLDNVGPDDGEDHPL
jgi:hypothetical protein